MKYRVNAVVTVSAYTFVEASSKAEALKIAAKRSAELGTSYDPREQADDAFVIEDADGEPCDLHCDADED